MEFIIRDIEGNEHGPADQDTLKKWIDEDRVTGDTPVRNALLGNWKTVAELDFVSDNLQQQAERLKESGGAAAEKGRGTVSQLKSIFRQEKKAATAFTYKHAPESANTSSRVWAFIFDLGLLTALLLLPLFAIASYYAYWRAGQSTDNSVAVLPARYILADAAEPAVGQAEAKPAVKPAAGTKTSPPPKKVIKVVTPTADKKQVAEVVEPAAPPAPADAPAPSEVVKIAKKKPALDNLQAEIPPCTKACESAGYVQGALWNDIKDGKSYICLAGTDDNARWIQTGELKTIYTVAAVAALGLAMLYYGLALGYFAQTFGMWFWGIFITKNDISEVYFFRAFLFTIMMFLLGVLAPACVYIFGRAPHDLLCGVRVINVVGKTQL